MIMGKYIMVVDDEQDIRGFLSDLLGDQGYTVRLAENGHEAMEMIQEDKPALILLDLMMPNGTGTDLYRRLHQHKELKDIPVIIISGLPGRHLAVSKSVPVFDKPIDESKVLAEIEKALG
jgi:CheY-like chemotaxis protein